MFVVSFVGLELMPFSMLWLRCSRIRRILYQFTINIAMNVCRRSSKSEIVVVLSHTTGTFHRR